MKITLNSTELTSALSVYFAAEGIKMDGKVVVMESPDMEVTVNIGTAGEQESTPVASTTTEATSLKRKPKDPAKKRTLAPKTMASEPVVEKEVVEEPEEEIIEDVIEDVIETTAADLGIEDDEESTDDIAAAMEGKSEEKKPARKRMFGQ